MTHVADLAVATISQAQRRVEIAAHNLANATTPAYKRRVAFAALVGAEAAVSNDVPRIDTAIDFRAGKMAQTGNPSDLALAGPGYFALRSGDDVRYTRHGQLTIDRSGRLVDAHGYALQLSDGNDLIVKSSTFQVRADGMVAEQGMMIGRIAVFMPENEGDLVPVAAGFRAGSGGVVRTSEAVVRQGAIELSNVTTGDEMVVLMEALRRAEAGQRIMNVYDDLMGRVITSFGDTVR